MLKKRPVISRLVADTPIPRLFRVRQHFPRETVPAADIPAVIRSQLHPFASRLP